MTSEFRTKHVIVTKYDPLWVKQFDKFRYVFSAALGDLVVAIEHIGSTSVPGLDAKPIIDIDIVISSMAAFDRVEEVLNHLGYSHIGDCGVAGREAFVGASNLAPTDGSDRAWPKHHLYVCRIMSRELRRHLVFRDWLRANPKGRVAYGTLKRGLAKRHPHDADAYCEGKTAFVEAVLAQVEA